MDLGAIPLSTQESGGETYYELPGTNTFTVGNGDTINGSFTNQGIWIIDDVTSDQVSIFAGGNIGGREYAIYVDFEFDSSLFDNTNQPTQWPALSPLSIEAWFWEIDTNTMQDIGELEGILSTANVSAVPVPAAVWLFGSGLIGLVGLARRKKYIL